MKRFIYVIAAFAAASMLCLSCDDDEDIVGSDTPTEEDKTSDGTAAFLTFGFYAEDNDALADTDYVVEVSDDMVIRLPEGTDKTALVPRFTTSENDAVYVGSVVQESGVTANDFTYTIDYIVTDTIDNVSKAYEVRVGKILSKVWSEIGSYSDNGLVNDSFAMCISPKDNKPYFFLARTNASEVDAAVVGELDGSTMTFGSEITYDSDGTLIDGNNMDIAIDEDGKIYVLYYNSAKLTDGSNDRHYYVYTGSGSSWTQVGSKFGMNSGSYYAMEIDPATKYPVVAFMANAAGTNISRRDLDLCYYDGSSWSSENLLTDVAGSYTYYPYMRVFNGALYLGGMVQTAPGSYFVYKYGSNSWTKVINALPSGVSQTYLNTNRFSIASDGTVYYCAGGDEDAKGTWYITVYKCGPNETEWTRVSSPIIDTSTGGLSTSARYGMDLYDDLPIVFYKNRDTDLPTAVMLDPETLQWDDPVTLGSVTMGTKAIAFETSADGIPYAAFLDSSDSRLLHVWKYDTEADDLPE